MDSILSFSILVGKLQFSTLSFLRVEELLRKDLGSKKQKAGIVKYLALRNTLGRTLQELNRRPSLNHTVG